MNKALARGSSRTASASLESRVAARIAFGWISSRSRAANANSSISRTGSVDEEIGGRDRQAPAIQREAVEPLGPSPKRRQREAESGLRHLLVELGEELAGQIADGFGVEEIELHEALDRRFSGAVGVMHHFGDVALMVEAEPLLGAAGSQMKVAADRPEEALGALEVAKLDRGEQAGGDQVGRPLDAVHIFADPVERVEVAQAALAVLDVGFDDVAAVAHLEVALVALGELGGDKLSGGPGDDLLAEPLHRGVENMLARPTAAGLRGKPCGR